MDIPWWKPFILGSDEFCNRTVGLKVPGGAILLNLNPRMRTETCDNCLDETRPAIPRLP
jgi:hypothetical protein